MTDSKLERIKKAAEAKKKEYDGQSLELKTIIKNMELKNITSEDIQSIENNLNSQYSNPISNEKIFPPKLIHEINKYRALKNEYLELQRQETQRDKYTKIVNSIQEITNTQTEDIQNAINAVIQAIDQETEYTPQFENALTKIEKFLKNEKKIIGTIDGLPGESKLFFDTNLQDKLSEITWVLNETAVGLALLALALLAGPQSPLLSIGVIVCLILSLSIFVLVMAISMLCILRGTASLIGLDPYLRTSKTGMAQAFEKLNILVSDASREQMYDTELNKIKEWSVSEQTTKDAVINVINTIAEIKVARQYDREMTSKIISLLQKLNTLHEHMSENNLHKFRTRYKELIPNTQCYTRFFAPTEYKLQAAIENFLHVLPQETAFISNTANEKKEEEEKKRSAVDKLANLCAP